MTLEHLVYQQDLQPHSHAINAMEGRGPFPVQVPAMLVMQVHSLLQFKLLHLLPVHYAMLVHGRLVMQYRVTFAMLEHGRQP